MGKGSRNRTKDFEAYRKNFDNIFNTKKESKDENRKRKETKV